ncbi:MAG: hypothetical protein ACI965_000859 [Paraglaciecola sp.]|jgi:hypothetical protein
MCQKTPLFNDTLRDRFAPIHFRAKQSDISYKDINESS